MVGGRGAPHSAGTAACDLKALPPILSRLEIREGTAVWDARPRARGWLAATSLATVLGVGAGVGAWGTNAVPWELAFWCLMLVWLTLVAMTVVAVRARYRLTLDFSARAVRVVEVLGLDRPVHWQGTFDEISAIEFGDEQQARSSAILHWRDEGAPPLRLLLAPDDAAHSRSAFEEFRQQARRAGLLPGGWQGT